MPRCLPLPLAAIHCGFVTRTGKPQIQKFKAECPVESLPFSGRTPIYDVKQLDRWVDRASGIEQRPAPEAVDGDPFGTWLKDTGGVGAA